MTEAVCYETPTMFARYTIANGSAIPKGTLLKLVTPNTCDAATANDDTAGGIAWMEKVASDGSTEIVAALNGTWGICGSGPIAIGSQLSLLTKNELSPSSSLDDEQGAVFGRALETITGSAVMKVRLTCFV